jgi:F0F1-type ATP synthase assembly protein I
VEDSKPNLNNKGPWWKAGVEIFSEISTWIIVPIVSALVFGKMLDSRFGTKPVIFLCLAGLGFLITCFGIFRIVQKYIKEIKETEEKTENK